jgi:hypothetical protein
VEEAKAAAAKSGQPVPVAGVAGLVAYPNGNVGPPPGGGFRAAPPAPVPATYGGPPGTAPVPATVTPPAAPAAQPATQLPPSTPTPAVTTTPPPPGPLTKNPDGTFTIPDEKLPSVLDYQARNRHTPSPDEMKQFGLVMPDNPQALNTAYAGVQEAEREAAAAHTTADSIMHMGIGGTDASRAIQAANTADKNAQDARNAYTNIIQQTGEKNAAALQNYYKDQNATLASAYKDILDRQQKGQLQTQAEAAAVGKSGQEVAFQVDKSRLDAMTNQATSARTTAINLAQVASQLSNLPSGFTGDVLARLTPGQQAWLRDAGIISGDQADAMSVINGLKNYLAVQMRPTGSGALRAAEMDRFEQALPDMQTQTPEGRRKALAFMQNYADRVQAESEFANDYYSRPGANGQPSFNLRGLQGAMDAPKSQGGLGEVIPHAPPLTAPNADHQAFLGNIAPGRPYYGWQINPSTGQRQQVLMVR